MSSLTYKQSGVNIDAGNKLIDIIKPLAKSTATKGVISGLGGFGALFAPDMAQYKEPILVSGTDGVGTKLKLAQQYNDHSGIGIDLVAMCVNDLIVQGAKPLFFLDYYATGVLDIALAKTVIAGIADGCKQSGCALIGGETAEMPGVYNGNDYDLAGFCVGIVDKDNLIDGTKITAGNSIIALASSGVHSNGFSLVRKILQQTKNINQSTINSLLTPTKIYISSMLDLLTKVNVLGISHITGGGLLENIPRVLPKNLSANIDKKSWVMPEIFNWLQKNGNIAENEMHRVFNCGIGMVVIVANEDSNKTIKILKDNGENAFIIGSIFGDEQGSSPKIYIK